jgi:chromosome partitioning protein
MRIISLLNQKGGVGKTTSTVNIGHGLTMLGKKVLLLDLDPQAHLTYSLGIKAHELEKTIFELLKGEATLDQAIQTVGAMQVIPSTLDLSGAEMEFSSVAGREMLLKEALKKAHDYDYILIDCPPNLSILTLNTLTTAREVFICVQTEYLALQGIARLMETIQVVKKRLNKSLNVTGVICTRFDKRKRLNIEVAENIKSYFGDKVFQTIIRDNIALAEAPIQGKTIFDYAPKSHGAEDYMELCKEIINQG